MLPAIAALSPFRLEMFWGVYLVLYARLARTLRLSPSSPSPPSLSLLFLLPHVLFARFLCAATARVLSCVVCRTDRIRNCLLAGVRQGAVVGCST